MPSPSEWEDRKSQILALIADNDLNTVLGKMKDQGFTASKAQYEQQFVKWNARKNLKKGEWREAIAVYDSLVTQHGERNVRLLISDIPVPKTRILQNRRRYCRGGPQTMDLATESDMAGHLPRGVSFRVLRAHGEWISPPPDELRIERSFTTGNPPVSSRSIFPASLRGAGALEDIPDAAIPDPSSSPAFPVFTAWEDRENPAMPSTAAFDPIALLSLVDQRPVSSSPFHFSPGQFDFNSAIWSESVPVDNSQKTPAQILSDLCFCQFEKRVLEGTGTTSLHTWLAGHTHFLQSPTIQFLSCITVPQQSSFNLLNTQLAEHHYLHSLLQPFMSLLPGEDLSFAQNVANFDAHIHRLLLFSFANGFPGLEMVDLTRVLGFLSQYRNIGSLLMQLKGIPGPYSKAIAVGLFKLCVESGEAQVAQQLLDAKRLNVNAIIFTQNGIRLTPLERASQLQNADMVRVLLVNGADANKSFEPFKGPISRLLYGIKIGTTINPVAQRVVSQLLDAGARVESSDLKHVLKSLHDNEVAFELALSLLDRNPDAWFLDGLLSVAARELDEKQMSQILNTVLPRYEIRKGGDYGYSRSQIHRALIACAEKGHSQLVEMLLAHHGYPVAEVLGGAIRGRHKDLAEWIASEYGPSLNAESHTINGGHGCCGVNW
ncbi:ankyrin [Apiospora arundinis]|uniref:Ankyrin n=1 Tax=Apiospora arundinis TaxID=335852 RepID=A0ABR2IEQ8_9PEZI